MTHHVPDNATSTTHPVGRFAERFYADRRLIGLCVILVISAGFSSLMILPRMEDPVLKQRAANIITAFPGADAERVEALVTEKIEDKLIDVPEIKRIRSRSQAGSSFIAIELRDEVSNPDPVWSVIRGKLEDSISGLPEGALRPEFTELNISAYAWIGAIVWDRPDPISFGVLRRLARELKDGLFTVPGTKEVDLFGDPLEEIIVEVDPEKAASVGLSAADIARQLALGDVKSSAGMLRGGDAEVVVQLENQFRNMEDILSATLFSDRAGSSLSLEDVATVRRSTPEPAATLAIIDGKPGVVISALLRPEQRIDQWAPGANRIITAFQDELPSGVYLQTIMEQEVYVRDRLQTLGWNLLAGVAAVSLVTFLFMGWRSSLLVTATLPLASLMVIAGMRFLGIPIHQMSITGLILAVGLLIDNAIIAADEIEISLRRGFAPRQAVGDMVSRLFAPLLASTVTTAFAFAPIALMEGPAGEFVGSIAITVMLAIFSSLLLSMTILPAIAAHLQSGSNNRTKKGSIASHEVGAVHTSDPAELRFFQRLSRHGISFPKLTQMYRAFLTLLLRHPVMGILLGSLLPLAGFVGATQLNEQFFPPADRDQFYIELELTPQATMKQTQDVAAKIDAILNQESRIQHTTWFLGESAPPFYYNIISRQKNSPYYGQAIVTLESNRNSLELIRRLQLSLDEQFPAVRILVRQLEQGPPFDAPVEVRLFGPDLDRLQEFGEELRALATTIPDLLHAKTGLNDARPVAKIEVDADQSAWVGLHETEISNQLFAHLQGLPAGSILEEIEEIPVRVRIDNRHRRNIADLNEASLFVARPTASSPLVSDENNSSDLAIASSRSIPVSAVASIQMEPQRSVIAHYNGRRINELQGFITAGTLPSKALDQFNEKLKASGFMDRLPVGYSLEYGGEASERDAAVGRLMANVTILAVGMVAALVLALASFRLAGLIGLVALLSVGLGLGALWLFGYPFGFMAIVGTMGLVGIAINDSIVVVAALRENRDVRAGDMSATVETLIEVTRHVLATTATTVVGFLPLMLGGGGFWPPLAVAIGTGVTGATLISLTLVPCVMRIITLMSPKFAVR